VSDARNVAIIVMTKPPSIAKSRLRAECGAEHGDLLAHAMLLDTLAAVAESSTRERVAAIDGAVGDWIPAGFTTVTQRGDDLAQRLASAFDDVGGPAIAIAIDTPQITGAMLDDAAAQLLASGTDAVLGPASDGGYWSIGLRDADPRVFVDVPMSTAATATAQLRRLAELELTTTLLPELRDIDRLDDAVVVATQAPNTRLAAALSRVTTEAR
jgi:hypothetical protein